MAPVIVLNTSDLCDDVCARIEEAEAVAVGVPVLPLEGPEGLEGAIADELGKVRWIRRGAAECFDAGYGFP